MRVAGSRAADAHAPKASAPPLPAEADKGTTVRSPVDSPETEI